MTHDPFLVLAPLFASYADGSCPHAGYTAMSPYPSRKAVRRLLATLMALMLPGYYGPQMTPSRFRRLAARARKTLIRQALRARRSVPAVGSPPDLQAWAAGVADTYFDKLAGVRRVLDRDIAALHRADPAARDGHEVAGTYPGLRAVATFRLAHELHLLGVPRVPRMMTEFAHSVTGIDIHPGASIGPGFAVDHGTGVVVGETAIVGENVVVYQGVTLGAYSFPVDKDGNLIRDPRVQRHPTVGDEVVLYAHVTVLGGDTLIGRNSQLGANVRLTETVGPESLVQVDKSNVRIESRKGRKERLAYEEWLALARLGEDGCPNCADVSELAFKRRP